MEIKEIKLSNINLSEFNTRKDLSAGTEDATLEDLAQSIREKGLLNPPIVKPNANGTYSLIAGQRRFLACQKLGWKTIPVLVRDVADGTDATIISLIENVHRADLNPIDKARAFQKIYSKYRDYEKVVKETGVTLPTIKKYLALLSLAPSIQERLSTVDGPAGIATLSTLAKTFDVGEQEEALEKIGGFKQSIQLEILKRSGGNLDKLDDLREQALEGAFHTRPCRGLDDCTFIPDELINSVKKMVEKFEDERRPLKTVVKKRKNDAVGLKTL